MWFLKKTLGVICLVFLLGIIVYFSFFKERKVEIIDVDNISYSNAVEISLNKKAISFPEGVVSNELLLSFKTRADLDLFLNNSDNTSYKVLKVLPNLNTVRIRILNGKMSAIPGASIGYNYKMETPNNDNIQKEVERNASAGSVMLVNDKAWKLLNYSNEGRSLSEIKIAVLDSDINSEHPAFSNTKITKIDVVGDAKESISLMKHGTAVASLIVGNGIDSISGTAQGAELLSVRIFDKNGESNVFNAAEGVISAVDSGAQVINISAGVSQDATILKNAVEYALSKGVVVVASAGNEGLEGLSYPAAYPGVISVGATDGANSIASFSNAGETLSVVAPGVGVISANAEDGRAYSFSGTSAASPLVSGIVASLIAENPNATIEEIKNKLINNADDYGMPGEDNEYGAGVVNYGRAARKAGSIAVYDLAICDFYLKKPIAGGEMYNLYLGVQNRGNVWSGAATYSVSLSSRTAGNHIQKTFSVSNLAPNETRSFEIQVPKSMLQEGLFVDANLVDNMTQSSKQRSVKITLGSGL